MKKDLSVVDYNHAVAVAPDIKTFGDRDAWELIAKASSQSQGWMKSTKVMEIDGVGCIVQVTTQQNDNVAEALVFVPGVCLETTASVPGSPRFRYLAKM